MSQVSRFLRAGSGGHLHWCPACLELHPLPKSWTFDGNLERPTFTPSFAHSGGSVPGWRCHYMLTKGVLHFQADCSHAMAGQSVPLPELPEAYRDPCDWSDG